MAKIGKVPLYSLEAPYRMTTRWRTVEQAERAAQGPGVKRIDEFTVETVLESL